MLPPMIITSGCSSGMATRNPRLILSGYFVPCLGVVNIFCELAVCFINSVRWQNFPHSWVLPLYSSSMRPPSLMCTPGSMWPFVMIPVPMPVLTVTYSDDLGIGDQGACLTESG